MGFEPMTPTLATMGWSFATVCYGLCGYIKPLILMEECVA